MAHLIKTTATLLPVPLVVIIYLAISSQSSQQQHQSSSPLPLCSKDALLDKRNVDYSQLFKGAPHSASQCHLIKYTKEAFVQCLDHISADISNKPLQRFVFLGDSRIWQQFNHFLKVFIIPSNKKKPNI